MKRFKNYAYGMLLVLVSGFWGSHASAVDYTVTDEASCQAFATGIGTTAGWGFGDTCSIFGGTLSAADAVTFSGNTLFRPQTDPFTNLGTVTIESSGRGYYGAALFDNRGTFTIIAAGEQPQNYSDIVNEGTFSTTAEIFNGGTFTNACGASFDGTLLNNPLIQEECPVAQPVPALPAWGLGLLVGLLGLYGFRKL